MLDWIVSHPEHGEARFQATTSGKARAQAYRIIHEEINRQVRYCDLRARRDYSKNGTI